MLQSSPSEFYHLDLIKIVAAVLCRVFIFQFTIHLLSQKCNILLDTLLGLPAPSPLFIFLGASCFLYLEICSTSVEQIKNSSDCLTLLLLSALWMLSGFMWVRRQSPRLSPCCCHLQLRIVDPLWYQVRTMAVYTHLSHRQLNRHGSKHCRINLQILLLNSVVV